jgi:hypothetical protein
VTALPPSRRPLPRLHSLHLDYCRLETPLSHLLPALGGSAAAGDGQGGGGLRELRIQLGGGEVLMLADAAAVGGLAQLTKLQAREGQTVGAPLVGLAVGSKRG